MTWVRSSRCGENGSCVEVARTPDAVMIRDSKLGDASPVLRFGPAAWRGFLASVRGVG